MWRLVAFIVVLLPSFRAAQTVTQTGAYLIIGLENGATLDQIGHPELHVVEKIYSDHMVQYLADGELKVAVVGNQCQMTFMIVQGGIVGEGGSVLFSQIYLPDHIDLDGYVIGLSGKALTDDDIFCGKAKGSLACATPGDSPVGGPCPGTPSGQVFQEHFNVPRQGVLDWFVHLVRSNLPVYFQVSRLEHLPGSSAANLIRHCR